MTASLTAIEIEAAWFKEFEPSMPRRLPAPETVSRICSAMPRLSGAVLEWFVMALADDSRKWFAAAVLARKPEGAVRLVEPLLRAAMAEPNPSFNRTFIRPLKPAGITWHDVGEPLLRLADSDDPMIRGGLSRARYWLDAELGAAPPDLHRRINTRQLRAFLASTDTYETRSLVAGLRLDPESVDPEHHESIPKAIAKARTHGDEYVRHRIEIQLGESGGPYLPLVRQ